MEYAPPPPARAIGAREPIVLLTCCRKIGVTLANGILSVIAFHEKAGRSQVGSGCFLLVTDIVSAELPLSPPFHPHSL